MFCLSLVGCGGEDNGNATKPDSVSLTGSSACERFASLASGLGCARPKSCTLDAACESAAVAWINCAAKDTRQCLCESDDGDLNCEGSFKPNEGPASCVAEYQAFDACSED